MIRTRFTELVRVDHPLVSAGMGAGGAGGELAGAVSAAGGLGVIGASWLEPAEVRAAVELARAKTSSPIGVNLLLFGNEELLEPVLELEPAVLSTAWPRDDQALAPIFTRAHEAGALVMHMVPTLADAVAAAEAGADVIVAQGTEGGGHVGELATTVLVRQVVKTLPGLPVLAAGGLADGAGLAAALALGADGVLFGTRFLATDEFAGPELAKRAVVASDGENTIRTTVVDILQGRQWPGAWSRVTRTRLVEEWLGREPELQRRREAVLERVRAARERGDPGEPTVWLGQSAALVDTVEPAGDVVRRVVAEAEEILRERLPALVRSGAASATLDAATRGGAAR